MNIRKFPFLLSISLCVAACSDSNDTAPEPTANIVESAVNAGSFKTLVAAVQAAGLADTLQGPGPFTVFAPPDSAFEKLPAGTVDTLLLPENKSMLASVLTYHVVAGKLSSADVAAATSAKTVQGANLAFSMEAGKVKVNGATVVTADIACSNGVIHTIDSVLLPP
jgi:uncharacterized surface protein with fasciclin (FAS1) repeats